MSVNTKTILNIKVDKQLKKVAQETAVELGIPLSTAINAFLKQFVREKRITLSANKNTPTPYLQKIIKAAEKEYLNNNSKGPFDEKELINYLDWMRYFLSKSFEKSFAKLPSKTKKRVTKKLKLFLNNPTHPILNNHPLSGKFSNYRSINISGDIRAIYKTINKDTAMFIEIGTHSKLYN
jgi:addiction module RelB/DinJ family antitoxin/addiction module RelE/StbE family toxin